MKRRPFSPPVTAMRSSNVSLSIPARNSPFGLKASRVNGDQKSNPVAGRHVGSSQRLEGGMLAPAGQCGD